ncbi:MAG: hypothetical protein U0M13_04130, partial [Desulfovibrio fairfieldensis]|nr:hypothetical protein [Desulfovibrio fairfieldensis]
MGSKLLQTNIFAFSPPDPGNHDRRTCRAGPGENHSFLHGGKGLKMVFDFAQFDAVTANFDPIVLAPHEFQNAVSMHTDHIARFE